MKKYKKEIQKNEFKISAPMWNEKSELPDGSYSVSDIQDYFECIIKKHQTVTNNPPVRVYVNKIENRCYLELLTPELFGNTNSKITENENSENALHLEITEGALVHCNVVNNDYQCDSRVLYRFVPNKSFGQFLDILP